MYVLAAAADSLGCTRPHLVAAAAVVTDSFIAVTLVVENLHFVLRAPAFHPPLSGHESGTKANAVVEAILKKKRKKIPKVRWRGWVREMAGYAALRYGVRYVRRSIGHRSIPKLKTGVVPDFVSYKHIHTYMEARSLEPRITRPE